MRIGDAQNELIEKGTTVSEGANIDENYVLRFSLMPPDNKASLGHPTR